MTLSWFNSKLILQRTSGYLAAIPLALSWVIAAQANNLPYMMAFYNNPTAILETRLFHCNNRHPQLATTLNEAYSAWRQRNDPYIPLVRERMFAELRKQHNNLQQILMTLKQVELQAGAEFQRQVEKQGEPVCTAVATELNSLALDFAPLFRQ